MSGYKGDERILRIVDKRLEGRTLRAIAKEEGVSYSRIQELLEHRVSRQYRAAMYGFCKNLLEP